MTDIFVGAYAAAWGRPEHEIQIILGRLAEEKSVRGLEVPWLGGELLTGPDRLRAIVTSIPNTMKRLSGDPAFGLASSDRTGRRAALADVDLMRREILALHDRRGDAVVLAVELHSAPHAAFGSSAKELAWSIEEIAEWEWGGVSLLLEHVDATVPGHWPAKGFLSLGDEIAAIESVKAPVRLVINWGRSAIELRSADRVIEHVVRARDAGLLAGVIFSGVAGIETSESEAWADGHLAFSASDVSGGSRTSLLTARRISETIQAAGELDFVGVKVTGRVNAPRNTEMILDSVALVARADVYCRQMSGLGMA